MTMAENRVLERIEEKVDKLMEFMAASNERVPNCKEQFKVLSEDVEWIKRKMWIFMGGVAVVVWGLDKIL
jgi:hypothetical protein